MSRIDVLVSVYYLFFPLSGMHGTCKQGLYPGKVDLAILGDITPHFSYAALKSRGMSKHNRNAGGHSDLSDPSRVLR